MPTNVIEAQMRTPGGKNVNRRLRNSGIIPAVLYGPGKESIAISVDPQIVQDILHSESGRNSIFTINLDGSAQNNSMVKDYQLDPVQGELIHVDFIQIAMDRRLQLDVNIEIVGEPKGVKISGGIMDFVSHLYINDYIRVNNIEVDPKVKVLSEPEVVVVTIIPPVKEEEPVAEEEAAAEAEEPEVIKKGKPSEEGEEEEKKS
jgi:large subunit ribosomal protein L25